MVETVGDEELLHPLPKPERAFCSETLGQHGAMPLEQARELAQKQLAQVSRTQALGAAVKPEGRDGRRTGVAIRGGVLAAAPQARFPTV